MLFPLRHLRSSVLNDTKAFKGGNDKLLVMVEKFHPGVTCQGMLESDKEDCGQIILDMPKDYTSFKFGPPQDTTVHYILPYRIWSRKNN